MTLPQLPAAPALMTMRILLGIIFIIHACARLYLNTVPGFGQFLESQGMPLGLVLAWGVTLGELVGGSLLVLGRWVRWAVLFHTTVILMGIFLVHLKNGWFVVGQHTGGVEYSLLILAALAVVYSQANKP